MTTTAPQQVPHSGIDADLKTHFDSNKKYFSNLLKKDFNDPSVAFTTKDLSRVEEAYEKAHKVREFEISLYWQRLNYMWTITAILLAGWGVLVAGLLTPEGKAPTVIQCAAIFTISFIGIVLTFLSRFIAAGGKYWQEVWEFHIIMLEPFKSGSLYAMPFNSTIQYKKTRPSISRSVNMIHDFLLLIWGLSTVGSVIVQIDSKDLQLVWILEIILTLFILIVFILMQKTLFKNKPIEVELDDNSST